MLFRLVNMFTRIGLPYIRFGMSCIQFKQWGEPIPICIVACEMLYSQSITEQNNDYALM